MKVRNRGGVVSLATQGVTLMVESWGLKQGGGGELRIMGRVGTL